MPWLRLDDGFTSNPKIAALSDSDFRVWMRLLCFCARARRGIVDELVRSEVNGLKTSRITRFIELDLLVQNTQENELEINEWEAYNPPRDKTQAERAKRYRKRKSGAPSRVSSRVTSPVTDRDASRVTSRPSHARASARVPVPYPTSEEPQGDEGSSKGSKRTEETPRATSRPNGLPITHELGLTRLLAWVAAGRDADDRTAAIIRARAQHLSEGALAKIIESCEARPRITKRAAYAVGALNSETASRPPSEPEPRYIPDDSGPHT